MSLNPKYALMGLGLAGLVAYVLTRKSVASTQPSTTTPAAPQPLVPMPALDTGLSPAERAAVQKALSRETVPGNLLAFAGTFDPMFPVAASVLRAKATSLQGGGTMTGGHEPCCGDCKERGMR